MAARHKHRFGERTRSARRLLTGRAIVFAGLLLVAACSEQTVNEPASSAPPSTSAETAVATTDAPPTTIAPSPSPTTSTTTTEAPAQTEPTDPEIVYVGAIYDQSDLSALGIGNAGFWFAQFDAPAPTQERPTAENAFVSLPDWIGPLNHFSILAPGDGCSDEAVVRGCRPGFGFRTFSQDGPASSSGGHTEWSRITAPDGTTGLSGAIVDPHTDGNSNNTVNRLQLEDGVPAVFYLHVIVDNTAGSHDPTAALRARANLGLLDDNDQVEPDVLLEPCDLLFNGVPDVYTFRFTGFAAQDYAKIRLSGTPGAGGASIAGILFDETFDESASTKSPTAAQGSNPLC